MVLSYNALTDKKRGFWCGSPRETHLVASACLEALFPKRGAARKDDTKASLLATENAIGSGRLK